MPARPIISREFIAGHKRRRIIEALAELATEGSYEETKISDIVSRAGVARKTLYENFEGKEEVFLAAFDTGAGELLDAVRNACATAPPGDARLRVEAGVGALLDYVVVQPAMAQLCMIEAFSATPAATQRYEQALAGFVDLARETLPRDDRLPETVAETVVGGVAWIVSQQIRRGKTAEARALKRELSDFVLAPYLDGEFEAADQMR